MSSTFPAAIDSLVTWAPDSTHAGHAASHNALRDAILAAEATIGITGSTDPASLTNRIATLEGATLTASTVAAVIAADASRLILQQLYLQGMPKTILSCGVPFVMFGGNGSSAGLQFTGSAGAFTLSAAIMTSAFNLLAGGAYAYFPANFGGQTIAAGLRFVTMTDDTHGTVYEDLYTSGQPTIPASPTPFGANLTGWLTQTTSEVTAISGFTLTGNSLGKNGLMMPLVRMMANNTAGAKYARVKIGSTVVVSNGITTTYLDTDMLHAVQAMGSSGRLLCTRNGPPGISGSFTSYSSDVMAVDTSVDQPIVGTMQLGTNTDNLIVVFRSITAQYAA